jgi:hypothetical protein
VLNKLGTTRSHTTFHTHTHNAAAEREREREPATYFSSQERERKNKKKKNSSLSTKLISKNITTHRQYGQERERDWNILQNSKSGTQANKPRKAQKTNFKIIKLTFK